MSDRPSKPAETTDGEARRSAARIVRDGILVLIVAVMSWVVVWRVSNRGQWLPSPPVRIGVWEGIDKPMSEELATALGGPRNLVREYTNPLDERVEAQFIAASNFSAFREPPTIARNLIVSAQRPLYILGKDAPVRAWVLRSRFNPDYRVMMLCWSENRAGRTRVFGQPSLSQGMGERFSLGLQMLASPDDQCVVRLLTPIHGGDTRGAQARRNLEDVAVGIHAGLAKTRAMP